MGKELKADRTICEKALRQKHASCVKIIAGITEPKGFPDSSVGKESAAMQETPVQFLGVEGLLGKGSAAHSSIFGLSLWLSW